MLTRPGNNSQPTLCVAAGKSGGHLIPALQLARTWHLQHPKGGIILCTYDTKLDEKIYTQYPFITEVQSFSFTTFVAHKIWRYPLIAYEALKACVSSWRLLRRTRAEKILTTGGFVAIPVALAARLLGIPVEVYELNVHAGKAVQALSLLGAKIFVVFQESLQNLPQGILTEYPIRFTSADILSREKALHAVSQHIPSALPLTLHRKTLFIVGGSQGSEYLNELVVKLVQKTPASHAHIQIIHQAGKEPGQYAQLYTQLAIPHAVFDFHPAMASFYQAADFVICRAGAGTLFELKFFQRPALIIPLQAASTSHQEENARAISKQFPALFEMKTQTEIDQNSEAFFSLLLSRLLKKE